MLSPSSSLRSSSMTLCSRSSTGWSSTTELMSTFLPVIWPLIVTSPPKSSRLKPGATSFVTVRLSPPSATMFVNSMPVGTIRFDV